MNFHNLPDYKFMSQKGFVLGKREIDQKSDLLFCVVSGGSPSGLYAQMINRKSVDLDFWEMLRGVKLDDGGGLEYGSTFTSELDVHTKFVQPRGIKADRYWMIDPLTQDPEGDCEQMQ